MNKKQYKILLSLPLLLILSGCSSLTRPNTTETDSQTTQVNLPETFNNRLSTSKVEFSEVDIKGWVSEFNSNELENLISIGLNNNPNLAATATRILDSEILVNINRSSMYPNLNANLSGARAKSNQFGSPRIGNSFDLGLSSQWEVDLWGKLRAQTRSALLQREATKQQYNAAKLSLSANIARAYFNLLTENTLLKLSSENTKNVERIESISVRSFKRGLVNALDVQLARRDLANSKRTLLAQKNSAETAARTLDVLLGDYPEGYQATTTILPTLPSALSQGVPAQVLERRPDIQAAALQILINETNVQAAKKALLPSIILNSSVGTSSSEIDNIFDPDFSVWSLLGNLAQPLLNRSALKGNLALEKNAHERAKLEYIDLVLLALSDVETALSNEYSLREQVSELTIARDYAEQSSDQARQQYEKGLVNANTLLTTERQYLTAEQTLLQTQNLLLQNRVALYVALGGEAHSSNQSLNNTKLDVTNEGATP